MDDQQYTWISFYGELADKLLLFKDDRRLLIEKLQKVYEDIGIPFPKLDSESVPADIDPFTVFGLFNKGISEVNRKAIIAGIAEAFDVNATQPMDFDGIPVVNNLNATFYAFGSDSRRGKSDIDNLWRVFEAELALAGDDNESTRESFVAAFETTIVQFGIGWKLTMGLYWTRPLRFISLDSRNRWYLGDMAKAGARIAEVMPKEKDAPIHDGAQYLSICDTVQGALDTKGCPQNSFPALSNAAFIESERVNQERKAASSGELTLKDKCVPTIGTRTGSRKQEGGALGDADVETVHYWLYAPGEGAGMWDEFFDRGVMGIGWSELGDLSSYDTKEGARLKLQEVRDSDTSQKNSAHAVWQFVHDIKPGDVVFAKRGRTEILGCGVVAGDYSYDPDGGLYPNLRKVEWGSKGNWRMDEMFAMKTLTDVTDYPNLIGKIETFFEQDAEGQEEAEELAVKYPLYSVEDFLSEVYMSEAAYDTLTGVLRSKKNIILQGAPGVGKTFVAKRLAYSMMGVKDVSRVMMVQFHQSYSYEDFIEGFRPSADGFELVKGVFYTFCKRAAEDENNDYFFVIDEINRGNLSKIFGELFMLIENDKRGSKNKLQLLYSRELFYVPSNVYLVGMMNTADRSLAMLDYALRRRFAFFDLKPAFASEGFREYRASLDSSKLDALVRVIERLNETISGDESLGDGFCIGHSYFCGMEPGDVIDAKLSAIVEYELVPMLKEYWFDEPDKEREWADQLRGALR